ncbi:hypothetical protein [Photobacterium kagoshimensis]|uniref:hypothetical protein n=1 Tax=Photobacterium kagoshimensis TaxID=2910242 RepID=UPI003D0DC3AE
MAKNLGMDTDDPASREGQFIAIGLANYTPTNVIGHCDKCSDCSPRGDDWVWSLKWQQEERAKHVEWLDKIDF